MNAINNGHKQTASDLFNGHVGDGGYAILTGMFGLDGEHALKAELHPLFAIAVRRDKAMLGNSAADESWLMFVRNQGNEGYCSSSTWYSGLDDYTFRLPWRSGTNTVEVIQAETDFDVQGGASAPTVGFIRPPSSDAGVYVTFHLGPPAANGDPSYPFADGVLHLKWTYDPHYIPIGPANPGNVQGSSNTGKPPTMPTGPVHAGNVGALESSKASTPGHAGASSSSRPAAIAMEKPEEGDEVEHMLGTIVSGLPAESRARVLRAAPRTTLPPRTHVVVQPAQELKEAPGKNRQPIVRRAVRLGPATVKAQRDAAQMRALCLATHDAPTGLPSSICKAVPKAPAAN